MEDFYALRLFLAAFFTFVAVFYTSLVIVKNRRQKRVVCMGRRYSQHWWNHLTFRVFRVSIWLVCVVRLFYPATDQFLLRLSAFEIPQLMWAGTTFMVMGFGLAIAANLSLGKQWRSGVDSTATQQLVSEGLYNISRNPAYVGVAIAQFGFFMALPSVFTLICLLVGWHALYKQVNIEEVALNKQFTAQYQQYLQSVPRWF
ncbi:methyltransferase family protein [Alteromonas sp. AMM-1]|uniref:methyltransferase family protein n=1 Tax=Alteromonas sp. AMM-1 TaxID=3394233 RepID=UPI0039A46564